MKNYSICPPYTLANSHMADNSFRVKLVQLSLKKSGTFTLKRAKHHSDKRVKFSLFYIKRVRTISMTIYIGILLLYFQ